MGRTLTDEELHAEMTADTMVGARTTTNALSAGVKLLIEQPEIWDRLTPLYLNPSWRSPRSVAGKNAAQTGHPGH